jgi:O-antigen ligase
VWCRLQQDEVAAYFCKFIGRGIVKDIHPEGNQPGLLRVLFWPFVITVALSPLPFGAVHSLAQAVVAILMFGMIFLWSVFQAAFGSPAPISVRSIAMEVFCGVLVLGWVAVQNIANFPGVDCHPFWLDVQLALREKPQCSASLTPGAAVETLLRLGSYASTFWLALQFGRERKRAHQIMATMAIAGMVYAIYGLVIHLGGFEQVLLAERATTRQDLSATLVNRNSYATLASLGLLCAVGLYQVTLTRAFAARRRGRDRLAFILQQAFKQGAPQLACILIMLTALFLTHSRGGITSGLVGIFCVIYLSNVAARQNNWLARLLALTLPVCLIAVYLLSGEGWHQRLMGTDFEHEGRLVMYSQVWEAIQAAPFAGHGAGGFSQIFPMFANEFTSHWDKAHNDWLEMLFELGWPAALLWFGTLAGFAMRCLVGVFRRHRDQTYPGIGFSACVVVGLHSLVDFSLQIPAVALTFSMLLGVGVSQSWHSLQGSASRPRPASNTLQHSSPLARSSNSPLKNPVTL